MSRVIPIVLVTLLCVAFMTEVAVDGKKILGGWTKVKVTDPEVQAVAAKATAHIYKARNLAMIYQLQEVTSAKYQIVKGKNFELTLKIGHTECFASANIDVEECFNVTVERCEVTAYVFQDKTEIKKFSCKKEKNGGSGVGGRQIPGGETDIDVNRKEVHGAAIFAVAEMARTGRRIMQLVRVTKATSQVVAGYMYRMTMLVNITEMGDDHTELDTCKVKVWEKSWETPRYILTDKSCLLDEQ